jgi:hypothetical protein
MAYVAGAMALLGTVMGTGSQLASSKANAQAAEQEAQNFEQNAALQERQFRRSAGLEAAKGRAISAASGVRADVGSPLLQELDFAKQSEIEAQSIRRNGTIQAAGRRYEARLMNRSNLFTGISGGMQGGSILSSFFANRNLSGSRYQSYDPVYGR